MTCPEQKKWLSNRSLVEFEDYHRPFLFPLEYISLAFIFVVAVSFNFATIITMLRVRSLRENLGNMLIINLCVMDLIVSLGSILPSLIDIFSEGYFLCMKVFCRIHAVLNVIGLMGNFATIILIAVHRFLKVVAADKINLTSKHVGFMIAVGWAFALSIIIPPLGKNATAVYTHGTHHCSPTWSCAYFITCMSIIYAVAVPAMIICYSAIFWTVRSSRKRLISHDRKRKADDESSMSEKQHTAAVTATVEKENLSPSLHSDAVCDDSFQRPSGVCLTSVNSSTTGEREPSKQPGAVEVYGPSHQSGSSNTTAYKVKRKVNRTHAVDIRIAIAGSLLVLTTTICWTPYVVVNWCTRTKKPTHAMSVFAMWLGYANSAIDPMIYSFMNKKLRDSLKNQISSLICFFWRRVCRKN